MQAGSAQQTGKDPLASKDTWPVAHPLPQFCLQDTTPQGFDMSVALDCSRVILTPIFKRAPNLVGLVTFLPGTLLPPDPSGSSSLIHPIGTALGTSVQSGPSPWATTAGSGPLLYLSRLFLLYQTLAAIEP